MTKVGIIGGGIIGLSSAYYLSKSGHNVTVIDKGNLTEGCSFGNAGMIVPSHFIPLATPGMISKGVKWMFNSSSPFYVRPRLSLDLLKWGYLFYKNSTTVQSKYGARALKELSLYSKSLYQQLADELPFDFGYHERGLMMLYQTKETEKEEVEAAHLANEYGIEAKVLSPEEVQQLEPVVNVKVRGGVYFPGDAHLTPQVLMNQLIAHLKKSGVELISNTEVVDFSVENNRITSLLTQQGDYKFDEVILAAGSWSTALGKTLNLSLPMQAGKGYSFTLNQVEKNIRIPSIFLEARVAVTPMGNSLRFGGTMEITGLDHRVSMNRVKGIVNAISKYYPDMRVEVPNKVDVWHGLRPCSPDGLPYIGRSEKLTNLIIATGHAMLGISLAPGTGMIVTDLISGAQSDLNMVPFRPERHS